MFLKVSKNLFLFLTAAGLLSLSGCGEAPKSEPWKDSFSQGVEFTFADQDPAAEKLAGPVTLKVAKNPTGFKTYLVYWSSQPGEAGRGPLVGRRDIGSFNANPLLTLTPGTAKAGDYLLLFITDGTDTNTVYTGKFARVYDLSPESAANPQAQEQAAVVPGAEGPGQLQEPGQDQSQVPGQEVAPGLVQSPQSSAGKIFFDYDQSVLKEEDKAKLDQNYAGRSDLGSVRLKVVGHCDERGSNAYNLALGLRRAQTVKNYLVQVVGLTGKNIETYSCGEEQPFVDQPNEEAWAQNRRAVTLNEDRKPYNCAAIAQQ